MTLEFELVRPVKEHAELIFTWRNDPETRLNSFHTEEKDWDDFFLEFQAYFRFPDLPPIFALKEHERVAFIRFEPTEDFAFTGKGVKRKSCALSINVAPQWRGRGVGVTLLETIKSWVQQQGYEALYGEVKTENTFSRKAFLKAGYRELVESVKTIDFEKIAIVRFVADFKLITEESDSVLIIAEAGSNWRMGNYRNDLIMAKRMIALAAEAKADVVKFQVFRPETIYVQNAGNLEEYGIEESMQDLFSEIYDYPGFLRFWTPFGGAYLTMLTSTKDQDARQAIVRLTDTGKPDPSFAGDGVLVLGDPFISWPTGLSDLKVTADGKPVLTAGIGYLPEHTFFVARFTRSGQPDPSFAGDGVLDSGPSTTRPKASCSPMAACWFSARSRTDRFTPSTRQCWHGSMPTGPRI